LKSPYLKTDLNKAKRLFLVFVAVFFLAMVIIAYDISKRTAFPGSKKLMMETLMPSDSLSVDSTKTINMP